MSLLRRVYLDYNASAPLHSAAAEAMVQALQLGNPSSVHFEGRAARAAIEKARAQVAALVGGEAKNVIFTSGGTEAAATALTPALRGPSDASRVARAGPSRLGIAAVEHACILNGHRFAPETVTVLPVDTRGLIDIDALKLWLAGSPDRPIVALQYANNETGVIQPVRDVADMVHAAGGSLVCDAVQAAGKVPLTFECGADVLLLSAHKFGGPKGAGALVLASDGLQLTAPLLRGGGQEKGQRGGTQNVAAIVGFGAAAAKHLEIPHLREHFERAILHCAPEAVIFGQNVERLPNTICFAVPDTSAETLLISFDVEGIALSSGSACSSGKVSASHVLKAMAVPENLTRAALRLSFGWGTTPEDVSAFAVAFTKIMAKNRARKQIHAA